MKVLTVVGARPQFIKIGPVSRALRRMGHVEYVVHTGQHYDYRMSQIFFDQLDMSKPDINLGVGSGLHGNQTGRMLVLLEEVMIDQTPDWVLVYGDTNSTLAGALAAAKLGCPVAHVEAGLRSFNRDMPEEINRVVTDHISTMLLCPGQRAVDQLAREGVVDGVVLSGDVMLDAYGYDEGLARAKSSVLGRLGLTSDGYVLMTIHRVDNTEDQKAFSLRIAQVAEVQSTVVWPVHPRAAALARALPDLPNNLRLVETVGRLEMIQLLESSSAVVTDSGGLQKEAYWARIPCFTLRNETEWVETVETGWNTLIGLDPQSLSDSLKEWTRPFEWPELYGDGCAADRIVKALHSDDRRTNPVHRRPSLLVGSG